jgi:hypothetical protein
MQRVVAIILLSALAEAQITRIGVQNVQRAPIRLPQQRPQQAVYNTQAFRASSFPETFRASSFPTPQERFTHVATKAESTGMEKVEAPAPAMVEAPAPAPESAASVNIFGTKIAPCGQGDECTYSGSSTADIHELCVSNVPYDKDKFWNGMPGKDAGVYEGNIGTGDDWRQQAQCRTIWEVGSPATMFGERQKGAFILPKANLWTFMQSWAKRLKYGFIDDVVVCDAVPASVLESEFSSATYNACEVSFKTRPYAPGGGKVDTADTNMRCQRFRDAIEKICTKCADQAPNKGASDALASKCNAIGMAAAALSEESSVTLAEYAIPLFLGSLMGAFVGLKVHRHFQKPKGLREPILEA